MGEEGRGDQWGGRAASTRSDNPARTRTESVARRPNRRQLGQTPRRGGGGKGGGGEGKGEATRQQPFNVQLRLIHPKQRRRTNEDEGRRRRSARLDSRLRFDRHFRPRNRGHRGRERYVGRGRHSGVTLITLSALGAAFSIKKSAFFFRSPQPMFAFRRAAVIHSESGAATRRQKATALFSLSLSLSLSLFHSSNHLCAPDDVILV